MAFRGDSWVQLSVPGLAQRPVVFIELAKALPDMALSKTRNPMKQTMVHQIHHHFFVFFGNSSSFFVICPDLDIVVLGMPHVTSQLGLSGATHALFCSNKNWVFRANKMNMSQYQTYHVSRSTKDQIVGSADQLFKLPTLIK